MSWNLFWIGLLRMCLLVCCLTVGFVIFVQISHSNGLGYAFALGFPYSLIPFFVISAVFSGLVTNKHRTWMSTRLDQWLAWCGGLVLIGILGVYVYQAHGEILLEQSTAARVAQISGAKPVPLTAPKQWTARSWTDVMPDCLQLNDSEIENQCPGRVSLTYCWRMDAAKEWSAKDVDCELNEKKQRIFATGKTALQVPWCRSYHEACLAELKPLQAQAIDK
jgi:hypothetical protein